jgi:hypothetical protein
MNDEHKAERLVVWEATRPTHELVTAKFGVPPLEEGCLRSSHNNRQ